MSRFFRIAALPILAALTLAATSAQAVPVSMERFRAALEDSRVPSSNHRAKPAATKPATQAQGQAMVCTTQQTTSKAGWFRKKTTKPKTVCTPVKTPPAAVPAGQGPAVESLASVEVPVSVAPVAPVPSAAPASSSSGTGTRASTQRPRNPAPTPNGNPGGNSTNVGSSSYVSPVISTPLLFAPTTSETGPQELFEASIAPPAEVPEPATLALLGMGLVGLGLARRRPQK